MVNIFTFFREKPAPLSGVFFGFSSPFSWPTSGVWEEAGWGKKVPATEVMGGGSASIDHHPPPGYTESGHHEEGAVSMPCMLSVYAMGWR